MTTLMAFIAMFSLGGCSSKNNDTGQATQSVQHLPSKTERAQSLHQFLDQKAPSKEHHEKFGGTLK